MSDLAYQHRELQIFHADVRRADEGTLAERKDSAYKFYEAMAGDPALVAERIEWLIDGNYGQGAYIQARQVLKSRMNKEAWFVTIIGALEWQSPTRMTIAVWKKLTPQQKSRLSSAVKRAMARGISEDRDPRHPRRSSSARRSRVSARRRAGRSRR